MQQNCFMYGDLQHLDEPPAEIMTVLLIGFQGQRKVLTGTRDELWREYTNGDGGHGGNGLRPIGWEYWCPQPLLTGEQTARCAPNIEEIAERKVS